MGLLPKGYGLVSAYINTHTYATWRTRPVNRSTHHRSTVRRAAIKVVGSNMTEAATLNGQPQTMLQEKLSALEARFATLEKRYQDLHERSFLLTESTSPSIGTVSAQVCGTTSDTNNVAVGNGLSLAASFCE